MKAEMEAQNAVVDTLIELILDSDAPEEHKNAIRLIRESGSLGCAVNEFVEKLILCETVDPVKVTQAYDYLKLIHANIETFFTALEKN